MAAKKVSGIHQEIGCDWEDEWETLLLPALWLLCGVNESLT